MKEYILEFNPHSTREDKRFIFTSNSEFSDTFHKFHSEKYFFFIEGKIHNSNFLKKRFNLEGKESFGVLIELLADHENIQELLHGAFIIIFYDFRRNRLKIIRDSQGLKLAYFTKVNNGFYFSNAIENLINIQKVTLNKEMVKNFLGWDLTDLNNTFFNEIKKISSSTVLNIGYKDSSIRKYNISPDLFTKYSDDYVNKFEEVFFKSVSDSLEKGKKNAVMLSGGIDSSAVSVAVKQTSAQQISSYSGNFSHVCDPGNMILDEKKYQENIISYTKFDHTYIELENISPFLALKESLDIFKQPIIIPNLYMLGHIAKKAQKDDVKVLLDGSDGDTIISHGYEVLYGYFKKLNIVKLIKEIRLYSKLNQRNFNKTILMFLKHFIKKALLINTNKTNHTLLKKNFFKDSYLVNKNKIYDSHKAKLNSPLQIVGKEYNYILFRHFDIEIRSPFYDERIINFCLNMPDIYKFNLGITRSILRKFLSKYIGKDHAYRVTKADLSSGLLANITSDDIALVRKEFNNINENILDLISVDKIENIFNEWESSQKLDQEQVINLMIFYNLNIFLKRYF